MGRVANMRRYSRARIVVACRAIFLAIIDKVNGVHRIYSNREISQLLLHTLMESN